MSKKITVTLSDKAEAHFNEILYSLDGKDEKPVTQSGAINYALESLADFEKEMECDILTYLSDKAEARKITWDEAIEIYDRLCPKYCRHWISVDSKEKKYELPNGEILYFYPYFSPKTYPRKYTSKRTGKISTYMQISYSRYKSNKKLKELLEHR